MGTHREPLCERCSVLARSKGIYTSANSLLSWHMSTAPPSGNTTTTTEAEAVNAGDAGNGVLLTRLKELEKVVQAKEQKIAELSQERRKQMEEIVDSAIANWLNQLPNLSDTTKQAFRKGVEKIAKVSFLNDSLLSV